MSLVLNPLNIPTFSESSSTNNDLNLSDDDFLEDLISDESDDEQESFDAFSAFSKLQNVNALQEETRWVYPKEAIEAQQSENIHSLFFSTGDWIFNLSFAYPLTNEVLFQSFALFRKFLTSAPVPPNELQLIAATCVWIYVKMDHNVVDSLPLLLRCCHDKYSKADFIRAEAQILSSVDYDFHPSTSYSSLSSHLHLFNNLFRNESLSDLSLFISQCSLLFLDFCPIRPSLVSLCSICLSGILTGSSQPPEFSAEFSNYTPEEILTCTKLLVKAVSYIVCKKNSGTYRKMRTRKSNVENYFQNFQPSNLLTRFSELNTL